MPSPIIDIDGGGGGGDDSEPAAGSDAAAPTDEKKTVIDDLNKGEGGSGSAPTECEPAGAAMTEPAAKEETADGKNSNGNANGNANDGGAASEASPSVAAIASTKNNDRTAEEPAATEFAAAWNDANNAMNGSGGGGGTEYAARIIVAAYLAKLRDCLPESTLNKLYGTAGGTNGTTAGNNAFARRRKKHSWNNNRRRSPLAPAGNGRRSYYAVRVGYATGTQLNDDDDDSDDTEYSNNGIAQPIEMDAKVHDESFKAYCDEYNLPVVLKRPPSVVKIRSAIFLYREDASQFIENAMDDGLHGAEHAAFDSIEGAEDYLLEYEREGACRAATVAEGAIGRDVDATIDGQSGSEDDAWMEHDHIMDSQIDAFLKRRIPQLEGGGERKGGNIANNGHGVSMENDNAMPLQMDALFVGTNAGLGAETTAGTNELNISSKEHTASPPETSEATLEQHVMVPPNTNATFEGAQDPMFDEEQKHSWNTAAWAEYDRSKLVEKKRKRKSEGGSADTEGTARPNLLVGPLDGVNSIPWSALIKCAASSASVQTNQSTEDKQDRNDGIDIGIDIDIDQSNTHEEFFVPLIPPPPKKQRKEGVSARRQSYLDRKEEQWESMYQKLLEVEDSDYESIMSEMPEEDEFRKWYYLQLKNANHDKLSMERRKKLEDVGVQLGLTWDQMYENLATYKDEHCTLDVDRTHDEALFSWLKIQRSCLSRHFKGSKTAQSAEKMERLVSLGFKERECVRQRNLDFKEEQWETMYKQLLEVEDSNYESISKMPEEDELRKWYCLQLKNANHDKLSMERRKKLEDAGVHLAPTWDQMYERLTAYQDEHCALDVDRKHDEALFIWLEKQRNCLSRHFKGKHRGRVQLSGEKIERLVSLGFKLDERSGKIINTVTEEAEWTSMLEAIVKYKEEHGTFTFPNDVSSLSKLERQVKCWKEAQKKEYQKLKDGQESGMTAQRLQRLTEIGIDLARRHPKQSWEQRMDSLRKFVEENGHCKPRKRHPLAGFVSHIRTFYKKREEGLQTCLTDERVNDLVELGFVFKAGNSHTRNTVRKSWDDRFQDLVVYKEQNGHTLVPQLSGSLGVWVRQQRENYRRWKGGQSSPMNAEKALRLTEIGFYFEAEKFKGRNNHLRDTA